MRSPRSSSRRARGSLLLRVTLGQFSLASGTRPCGPSPQVQGGSSCAPSTPNPSAPSRADFPAEAGGGAVRGEGTASGGGCLKVCEQFRFRREISGDNPGPGWLSSTGNLELGDSCGPGVELLLPATAPTGRAPRARPGLVGKDLKVPYTHTHTQAPAQSRAPLPLGRGSLHEFGW